VRNFRRRLLTLYAGRRFAWSLLPTPLLVRLQSNPRQEMIGVTQEFCARMAAVQFPTCLLMRDPWIKSLKLISALTGVRGFGTQGIVFSRSRISCALISAPYSGPPCSKTLER
jgi:hypothetical protein